MSLITRLFRDLHIVFGEQPMRGLPVQASAFARSCVPVDLSTADTQTLLDPADGASAQLDKLVITVSGATNVSISKSTDGGTTWADVTGLLAFSGAGGVVLDHELAPIQLAANEVLGLTSSAAVDVTGYAMVSEVPA